MTDQEIRNALEPLVDSVGVADVLIQLHIVCLEKAEHVGIEWQDKTLAKVWERLANKVKPDARTLDLSKMTGHA